MFICPTGTPIKLMLTLSNSKEDLYHPAYSQEPETILIILRKRT